MASTTANTPPETAHDSPEPDQDLKEALQRDPRFSQLLPLVDTETLDGAPDFNTLLQSLRDFLENDPELQARYQAEVPDAHKRVFEKRTGGIGVGSAPAPPPTEDAAPLTDSTKPSSFIQELFSFFEKSKAPSPYKILEGDGKHMEYIPGLEFQNWGLTVKNNPSDTFIARTKVGLCNLVKWATSVGKKVRVAGYRHTWTDFFSSDDQILVMLLPLSELITLPSPEARAVINSDLQTIEFASPFNPGEQTALCRVGAGCTNDLFRRACLQQRSWAIPFNVIMIEITFGGSNAPICHGAGLSSSTLSDLVAEFEYVDARGNLQTITDPAELRAASGCFGVLGICTSVTLRLDQMAVAVMNPVKVPVGLAIPPPHGYKTPKEVNMDYTEKQLEEARAKFIKACEDNYYIEWFWFPYQDNMWVNCWTKQEVKQASDLAVYGPYPSDIESGLQWVTGWMGQQLFASGASDWLLSGKSQATLMGQMAMLQMPDVPNPDKPLKTLVSEALHFRRGIQNMRVWDSEWEIPIPEALNAPGKRDYEMIQRAWWDGLTAFFADKSGKVPMRIALEMRLTGHSNVIMAPQRGNSFGTISIEVLTIPNTPKEPWRHFTQVMADTWTQYRDKGNTGELLNARPHWAKQWEGLTVQNMPIVQYLREKAYAEQIPEFIATLEGICKRQGFSLKDARARFGNPFLEKLLLSGPFERLR